MTDRSEGARLQPLIDELIAAAEQPLQLLPLRFGACRIDLCSNSSALIERLADYFLEFVDRMGGVEEPMVVYALQHAGIALPLTYTSKRPDPGKTRVKEEYFDFVDGRVVRKRLTGMQMLFTERAHLALGDCLANDNQVVNFLNNRYIAWLLDRGGLLCHSAGVVSGGRGLALSGFSGMGKSTLSLALMNRGCVFVSNDRLILRRANGGVTMHGIPKQPRINPGTIVHNPALVELIDPAERERLAALPDDELWRLEQKFDGPIHHLYGSGRFELDSTLDAQIVLNWRRDGSPLSVTAIDLDDRRDLLAAIIKETGLFYRRSMDAGPGEESYVEAFRGVTVYEVTGGVDFDALVDICFERIFAA